MKIMTFTLMSFLSQWNYAERHQSKLNTTQEIELKKYSESIRLSTGDSVLTFLCDCLQLNWINKKYERDIDVKTEHTSTMSFLQGFCFLLLFWQKARVVLVADTQSLCLTSLIVKEKVIIRHVCAINRRASRCFLFR